MRAFSKGALQHRRDELHSMNSAHLPIVSVCASCKKLKDGAGAWSWLGPAGLDEPNTWFSHGLCPDCFDQQCSDMLRTPVRSES